MRLVYLSPVNWSSFAQRPHKFVTWFQREQRDDVIWIDPYPTRLPSLADFRRLSKTEGHDNTSNPQWLTILKPTALPIEPLPGSGWVNKWAWREVFRKVASFARSEDCLVAIGKPSMLALGLLSKLRNCRSLYDAMDDFPAFYSGLSRFSMRLREEQLVKRVDTVLTSSTAIQNRWIGVKSDVQLIHNAVDAAALPKSPHDSTRGEQKLFGYVGTIATWFDWDWVIALARARPADTVRLIGPVFAPCPSELPNNIELKPSCSHHEALLAMQRFDIGLIPFKRNDLTAAVDPIKYYEYRALGLPIVSSAFGEMAFRANEDGTFLSHNADDIGGLIEKALHHCVSEDTRQQFSIDNSWETRFASANIL
jgi:glycosyltransferase involved in cell wall biosynthesis